VLVLATLIGGAFILFACDPYEAPGREGLAPKAPVSGKAEHWYHPEDAPVDESTTTLPAGVPLISECGQKYFLTVVSTVAVPNCATFNLRDLREESYNAFINGVIVSSCTSLECSEHHYELTGCQETCLNGTATSVVQGLFFCDPKKQLYGMAQYFGDMGKLTVLSQKQPNVIDLTVGDRTQVVYDTVQSTSTALYAGALACGTTNYYQLVYRERRLAACEYISSYQPYVQRALSLLENDYLDRKLCPEDCPKDTAVLAREWHCEIHRNKDNVDEGWVTVTLDFKVHCGK